MARVCGCTSPDCAANGCALERRDRQLYGTLGSYPAPVPCPQRPYKCPVCYGAGSVAQGFYGDLASTSTGREVCRTCYGAGIIWEPVPFTCTFTSDNSACQACP